MAVINSSLNLIFFHVLFAEIQRSFALESEKVERIRNITFILQSPTFQGPQRIFFFFLLLANDFSNKNINYSQLLSDSEFS